MRSLRGVLLLSFLLSSCAKESGSREQNLGAGDVALIGEQYVQVNEEQRERICAETDCEKNVIYSIHLGKKKPKPPETNPKKKEVVDYSKAILGLKDAWKINKGSRSVIVAVVDTGVDYAHPDLRQNIWFNEKEKNGKKGIDDDGNGYVDDVYGYDFYNDRPNAMDDNGHGTHVAGTIAAPMNKMGTIGVAPNVRVMPLKFMGAEGYGDSVAALKAVEYAVKMGAVIISNSWGGKQPSKLMSDLMAKAVNANIAVIAAAGNDGSDNDNSPSYPASYEGVLSVGSSDQKDSLSSFSNYGNSSVEIAAPGSDIFSTVPGAAWDFLSGTSMATPQVSGALALARSQRPDLSLAALREALCESAKKILLSKVKCGRMDVGALMHSL